MYVISAMVDFSLTTDEKMALLSEALENMSMTNLRAAMLTTLKCFDQTDEKITVDMQNDVMSNIAKGMVNNANILIPTSDFRNYELHGFDDTKVFRETVYDVLVKEIKYAINRDALKFIYCSTKESFEKATTDYIPLYQDDEGKGFLCAFNTKRSLL